jgi:hypothetical protein
LVIEAAQSHGMRQPQAAASDTALRDLSLPLESGQEPNATGRREGCISCDKYLGLPHAMP